jgi:hypothetical protein
MSAIEYSVIVEQPLYDVLTQLGRLEDAQTWAPRNPTGGMRFEAIAGGTRVTVFGVGDGSAPGLLASLMHSFIVPSMQGGRRVA